MAEVVKCRICGEEIEAYATDVEGHMQNHRPSEVEWAATEKLK